MDSLMVLTACTCLKLQTNRIITLNDSLLKKDKAKWHINNIKIVVLNMNVTYYLILNPAEPANYKITQY